MVSTMPSAVSGFTNAAAPSAAVAPSGSGRHAAASTTRYCVYMAPGAAATTLPSSALASSPAPTATTVPAPSLPTGSVAAGDEAVAGGAGEQEAEVRRVDRGGLHPKRDLSGPGSRHLDLCEAQLHRPLGGHLGP